MMENKKLLHRIGFSDMDLDRKTLSFPNNQSLSDKLGAVSYYAKSKSEQVKTRFYWIKADNIPANELKIIHERLWNENKADLLFLEKGNSIDIKYISTSPKEDLLDIVTIPTNVEDSELLNKISKEHITTGAFWIEYSDALERVKQQRKTVDEALVDSLSSLRVKLDNIYKSLFPEKEARGRVVQALIDRTLFIKFLEDKKIINSYFYHKYFGSEDIHYKDLLERKDAKNINELFCRINEVFNNKLFETPTIKDADLLDSALTEIVHTIKGTKGGQLCLFDFQFDIIPIEFISHIYQIFLDDKKARNGIFYTPEGLANLLLDNVIKQEGKVLDPSCGSGIFLVLAFRRMYKSPVNITETYDKIQHRLDFIRRNIFGIELENTAARLAVFSLYLEVLNDITSSELNKLITEIIQSKDSKVLFSIDFSENIKETNALIEEGDNAPFVNEKFSYIIGNPPWFVINKNATDENDTINYSYWNKYRNFFTLERQISQCFLHRIKYWSTKDTKFGFIVNSSNFINESIDFQKFIFSSYHLQRIFELYHVKEILFDYAKEPACLLVFDNQVSQSNSIEYFLPKLNSFAETFKTVLLNQSDIINIKQDDLLKRRIRMRDFLIGTENELALANKLERECFRITDIMLVDKRYDSYRGFSDWGANALENEFQKNKRNISDEEYESFKQVFLDKYYRKSKNSSHNIPFIKSAQLERFHTKSIDVFCLNDISNFDRARNSFIYEGEKILCSRIGGEIKAVYSNEKIYFGTDIYVIKLQNPELYHTIVCCLNSDLLNYFSQVKLRKRIDSALSRLDSSDLKKIPVPKRFNKIIVEQLDVLSKGILNGDYSFEDKKDEINHLVFDLYELDYIEKQRILDFFISKNKPVTKKMFEDYCTVFFKTFRKRLKTGIVKMEYSYNPNLPLDISGVKIIFGENTKSPKMDKVQLSINYELLKQVGSSVLISLKERIYSEDSIFIIKDTNPKNWTKSAAYDDARVEIEKLLQV